VFSDEARVMDGKERLGMKMRTIWMIPADMRNQGYNLPDLFEKTSYQW